jgi:hypothetical protein
MVLVLSLGLHWALLQTVAWTGMILRYSQHSSLKAAVVMTFDGKHPCPICRAVQTGRAQDKGNEQQRTRTTVKLDFAVVWQAAEFKLFSESERIPSTKRCALARREAPPKPHPRLGVDQGRLQYSLPLQG